MKMIISIWRGHSEIVVGSDCERSSSSDDLLDEVRDFTSCLGFIVIISFCQISELVVDELQWSHQFGSGTS